MKTPVVCYLLVLVRMTDSYADVDAMMKRWPQLVFFRQAAKKSYKPGASLRFPELPAGPAQVIEPVGFVPSGEANRAHDRQKNFAAAFFRDAKNGFWGRLLSRTFPPVERRRRKPKRWSKSTANQRATPGSTISVSGR